MDLETIEFDVTDQVATLTLNRPESMNAFNDRMGDEIVWFWETVRDTMDIHAVVIQANGERAFCTGADIKGGMKWVYAENLWGWMDPGGKLSPKFHHKCWKPVVVAAHGLCAGGAHYFLNEADIVICSDDAEFFDPHANMGTVCAVEPIGMLARGVPLGDVLRWTLMGSEERITAETALRLGLVTEVVARDDLRARAREIAVSIAQRDPIGIQGSVKAIWESLDMTRTPGLVNGFNYTTIGNPPHEQGRTHTRGPSISYR